MEIKKRTRGRPGTATPSIKTSVNISPEFYQLCIEHGIVFTDALRVGISILLAEKGVSDYDNRLTIVRRLNNAIGQLSDTSQELNELKDKYKEI